MLLASASGKWSLCAYNIAFSFTNKHAFANTFASPLPSAFESSTAVRLDKKKVAQFHVAYRVKECFPCLRFEEFQRNKEYHLLTCFRENTLTVHHYICAVCLLLLIEFSPPPPTNSCFLVIISILLSFALQPFANLLRRLRDELKSNSFRQFSCLKMTLFKIFGNTVTYQNQTSLPDLIPSHFTIHSIQNRPLAGLLRSSFYRRRKGTSSQ